METTKKAPAINIAAHCELVRFFKRFRHIFCLPFTKIFSIVGLKLVQQFRESHDK